MFHAPVGDHIPMHIWATLTELNGLSREEKDMRLRSVMEGHWRGNTGYKWSYFIVCMYDILKNKQNFKNRNFLKNKMHIFQTEKTVLCE